MRYCGFLMAACVVFAACTSEQHVETSAGDVSSDSALAKRSATVVASNRHGSVVTLFTRTAGVDRPIGSVAIGEPGDTFILDSRIIPAGSLYIVAKADDETAIFGPLDIYTGGSVTMTLTPILQNSVVRVR
jgi:hypothetical protein